jgi:hypothetical protein
MPKTDASPHATELAQSTTAAQGAAVAPLMMQAADDLSAEHRRFPRAQLEAVFRLWIGEGADQTFAASLRSDNLSVSGAFLRSTFFLPMGTEVSVSFSLEGAKEPVQARARVVREQRPVEGRRDASISGMGLRFTAFHGQTEVTLARLFLGTALRHFVEEYLRSPRARALTDPAERVVDALAAWELSKVSGAEPRDPWGAPALRDT